MATMIGMIDRMRSKDHPGWVDVSRVMFVLMRDADLLEEIGVVATGRGEACPIHGMGHIDPDFGDSMVRCWPKVGHVHRMDNREED